MRKWEEVLLQPGCLSLYDSMVTELAEYLGDTQANVAAACAAGLERVAEEWKMRQLSKASLPSEVTEFYRITKSYLFDLTAFNSEYPHIPTLEALLAMARQRSLNTVLDFGSGIGSVGLFFATNGMDVTLADVSEPLLDYVAWRFRTRNLPVRLINLNHEELPRNTFDVVTTFDVLEHLAQPADCLRTLAASMKLGGVIALNVEQPDMRFPQHIATYEEVFATVAAAGFHRLRFLDKTEIFERVARGTVTALLHSWWGKLWYGLLYRKAMTTLELLHIKQVIRRWVKGVKH